MDPQLGWRSTCGGELVLVHRVGIATVAAQVAEDGGDDLGIEDEGEDAHVVAATGAAQRIDLEDAPEELGPAGPERAERRPFGDGVVVGRWESGLESGVGEDAEVAPTGTSSYGVGAGVADEDFVMIGDMGEEEGEELERVEVVGSCGRALALVGDEPDAFLAVIVLEALEGDGGSCGVARELEHAEGVVGLEANAVVGVESRVRPSKHGLGDVVGEKLPPHELTAHGCAEGFGEDRDVVEAEMQERSVQPEGAVGDEEMQVGMPVDEAAKGLDGGHDAGDDIRLAEGRSHEVAERVVGGAGEDAEEPAVVKEEGSQALGHREDVLAVGDGVEDLVLEPVGPDLEPFGVAGGAEDAGLAAEGDEEFRMTLVAADARETLFEDAAVEEALDGPPGGSSQATIAWLEQLFVDEGESVEVVLDEAIER